MQMLRDPCNCSDVHIASHLGYFTYKEQQCSLGVLLFHHPKSNTVPERAEVSRSLAVPPSWRLARAPRANWADDFFQVPLPDSVYRVAVFSRGSWRCFREYSLYRYPVCLIGLSLRAADTCEGSVPVLASCPERNTCLLLCGRRPPAIRQ